VHVRQALQQTAAIGAWSPYFAAACIARPCQIVFTLAPKSTQTSKTSWRSKNSRSGSTPCARSSASSRR
jgi:hypothetical protein